MTIFIYIICYISNVNWMAAGSRLPRSSHGFFLLSPTFQNILSEVNINILGLYKAFWYTGSAFTKYFNHNKTMFHLGYLEMISHSLGFLWIQIHENSKKKIS